MDVEEMIDLRIQQYLALLAVDIGFTMRDEATNVCPFDVDLIGRLRPPPRWYVCPS